MTSSIPSQHSTARPRPVLLYGMASAAVTAFLGFAGIGDLMPKSTIAWVALGWAVIGGAWAVYVQSVVTPVADPRDNRGVPLVPDPAIEATIAQSDMPEGPGTSAGPGGTLRWTEPPSGMQNGR